MSKSDEEEVIWIEDDEEEDNKEDKSESGDENEEIENEDNNLANLAENSGLKGDIENEECSNPEEFIEENNKEENNENEKENYNNRLSKEAMETIIKFEKELISLNERFLQLKSKIFKNENPPIKEIKKNTNSEDNNKSSQSPEDKAELKENFPSKTNNNVKSAPIKKIENRKPTGVTEVSKESKINTYLSNKTKYSGLLDSLRNKSKHISSDESHSKNSKKSITYDEILQKRFQKTKNSTANQLASCLSKKTFREKLPGYNCEICSKFYNAVGEDIEPNKCSRHKCQKPPSSTPEGFYDLNI